MTNEINVNNLSEMINDKMDNDMGNLPQNIDYVVEWKSPTSSNPSWYRLYKSGWIEQGGRVTNTAASGTLTFNKPFFDTGYVVIATEGDTTTAEGNGTDTAGYGENIGFTNYTTSSCRYSVGASRFFAWYACGMVAI